MFVAAQTLSECITFQKDALIQFTVQVSHSVNGTLPVKLS